VKMLGLLATRDVLLLFSDIIRLFWQALSVGVINELGFCNISFYSRYICDKLQSFAVTQLISSFALL